MEKGPPVSHDHAGQAEGQEDGDGATDQKKDQLFELNLLAVHPDYGLQQMHGPPIDDFEPAPVEDMNEQRNQNRAAPQGQTQVKKVHLSMAPLPRLRKAR